MSRTARNYESDVLDVFRPLSRLSEEDRNEVQRIGKELGVDSEDFLDVLARFSSVDRFNVGEYSRELENLTAGEYTVGEVQSALSALTMYVPELDGAYIQNPEEVSSFEYRVET